MLNQCLWSGINEQGFLCSAQNADVVLRLEDSGEFILSGFEIQAPLVALAALQDGLLFVSHGLCFFPYVLHVSSFLMTNVSVGACHAVFGGLGGVACRLPRTVSLRKVVT